MGDDRLTPWIPIFEAGRPRDTVYTANDLRDIVRNFKLHQSGPNARFRPPVVIGHEEEQPITQNSETAKAIGLDNTGIPSWGEVADLKTDGKILSARVEGLPKSLAWLIGQGRYKGVSPEIYTRPPKDVPAQGKMFRRLSFLGGELPQVKNYADVLKVAGYYESHGEKPAWRPVVLRNTRIVPRGDYFEAYSEVHMATREELLAKLNTLADDKLAEVCGWSDLDPDALLADLGRRKYGDKFSEHVESVGKVKPEPTADEIAARADLARARADARRLRVETFCETHVQGGKILPAEMDRSHGGPNLADLLSVLPDEPVVHKFSEKGQEKEIKVSPYEAACRLIEKRPALAKFGERVKSGAITQDVDEEVAKVERFSETPALAHALAAADRTPEQYVERFKELRKKNPKLTAKQYGVTE